MVMRNSGSSISHKRREEWIDAHAEPIGFESVTQLAQIEDASVHRAAAPLRRIQSGAQPLEIRSVAAVDRRLQKAGRRHLQRVFRLPLDGLRQIRRRHLAEREINSGQMLAKQRVEFGIVCGAVLRAEPPAPVAALRGQ